MKLLFKILGIAIMLAAIVFNVRLSRISDKSPLTLAYVRNVAQAQTESQQTYAEKQEAKGSSVVTHTNTDNTTCTESFDFDKVVCLGSGAVECTPSYTQTNVVYDPNGDCPFH